MELLAVEISCSPLGCLIKSLHLFPKNFISSLRIALGVSHCLCVYVIYWTHISVGSLEEDFSFCHIILTYRIYTGCLEFFHSRLERGQPQFTPVLLLTSGDTRKSYESLKQPWRKKFLHTWLSVGG